MKNLKNMGNDEYLDNNKSINKGNIYFCVLVDKDNFFRITKSFINHKSSTSFLIINQDNNNTN